MTALLEQPTKREPLRMTGYKEKDREPYVVNVGPKHQRVLRALADAKPRGQAPHHGMTDSELTFGLGLHMAAARRCELRDIGAVRRAGRRKNSWAWTLTDKGRELLKQLEETQ